MKNYRKEIAWKLLALVLVLALAGMVKLSLTPPQNSVRSPYWYSTHCEYLPLVIADHVPDGLFVNCK